MKTRPPGLCCSELPQFLRSSFKPLLERAALPESRFHDLRHTFATILLSRGVHAKFVQELLGHATIAITLDTYSHVLPVMGGGSAAAMDEALRCIPIAAALLPKPLTWMPGALRFLLCAGNAVRLQ